MARFSIQSSDMAFYARAEFQGRLDIGCAKVPMDLGKEGMRKTAALVIDINKYIQMAF